MNNIKYSSFIKTYNSNWVSLVKHLKQKENYFVSLFYVIVARFVEWGYLKYFDIKIVEKTRFYFSPLIYTFCYPSAHMEVFVKNLRSYSSSPCFA